MRQITRALGEHSELVMQKLRACRRLTLKPPSPELYRTEFLQALQVLAFTSDNIGVWSQQFMARFRPAVTFPFIKDAFLSTLTTRWDTAEFRTRLGKNGIPYEHLEGFCFECTGALHQLPVPCLPPHNLRQIVKIVLELWVGYTALKAPVASHFYQLLKHSIFEGNIPLTNISEIEGTTVCLVLVA